MVQMTALGLRLGVYPGHGPVLVIQESGPSVVPCTGPIPFPNTDVMHYASTEVRFPRNPASPFTSWDADNLIEYVTAHGYKPQDVFTRTRCVLIRDGTFMEGSTYVKHGEDIYAIAPLAFIQQMVPFACSTFAEDAVALDTAPGPEWVYRTISTPQALEIFKSKMGSVIKSAVDESVLSGAHEAIDAGVEETDLFRTTCGEITRDLEDQIAERMGANLATQPPKTTDGKEAYTELLDMLEAIIADEIGQIDFVAYLAEMS